MNIFEYTDIKVLLNDCLKSKKQKNSHFSLRSWCKQIGLEHPGLLSMILQGKRKLKAQLATKIKKTISFQNETEEKYFDFLILYTQATTTEEKNFYANILETLRPTRSFTTIELDWLRFFSHWYYVAIIEMTTQKNFKSDSSWIQKRLGNSISIEEINEAIHCLQRLNILTKNDNGKLSKTCELFTTPSDIPSEHLKRLHEQFLSKAKQALYTQKIEERDITTKTFSINKKHIPKAKKLIQEFRKSFSSLMTEDAEDTYQLNIQLFNLTPHQDHV